MAKAALKEVVQETRRIYATEKNVQVLEVVCRQFKVTVASEHTVEDLLNPDYWIHNARRFVKDSILYCFHEKGEWSAILWVYDCTSNFARCRVMSHTDYKGTETFAPDPDNYETRHVPNVGWSVIFKPNKTLMASALGSELEAKQFIERMISPK